MEKEITGEMLLSRNIWEIPTLLDPLLPKSGLVCLAGSSDTGKSAFLRQLSMSVSAGSKTFLGMRLNVGIIVQSMSPLRMTRLPMPIWSHDRTRI